MLHTSPAHSVLIVDDDSDFREVLSLLLTAQSLDVKSAASALSALGILEAGFRPCVILLDIRMPELNGWDFLDLIHENAALSEIPVVMISGERAHAPDFFQGAGHPGLCESPLPGQSHAPPVRSARGSAHLYSGVTNFNADAMLGA